VRAGVREILALEEDPAEPDRSREAWRVGERRRSTDPVAQDPRELALEFVVRSRFEPSGLELSDRGHERLGQVLPAELSVSPGPRLRDHACTVRLIDASP